MCRLSWNLGTSTSWYPQGLSRSVMGLLYLTSIHCVYKLGLLYLASIQCVYKLGLLYLTSIYCVYKLGLLYLTSIHCVYKLGLLYLTSIQCVYKLGLLYLTSIQCVYKLGLLYLTSIQCVYKLGLLYLTSIQCVYKLGLLYLTSIQCVYKSRYIRLNVWSVFCTVTQINQEIYREIPCFFSPICFFFCLERCRRWEYIRWKANSHDLRVAKRKCGRFHATSVHGTRKSANRLPVRVAKLNFYRSCLRKNDWLKRQTEEDRQCTSCTNYCSGKIISICIPGVYL